MTKKCIVPWTQMEICATGTVRPCAEYHWDMKNDDGSMLDFNDPNISIQDIWNGHEYAKLRQQFINGEQPEGCKKCWQQEEQGIQSRRERELIVNGNKYLELTDTIHADNPTMLDLKLGNLCNLKCRICNSEFSSNWAEDELELYGEYNNKNPGKDWTTDIQNWEDIKGFVNKLETIYLSGGEPFVIEKHYELLEHIISLGISNRIRLKFSTNGTIKLNDRILNLLKQFKTVDILYSIDDIGENYEYQRPPARWHVIERNFKHALEQDCIAVTVTVTVSLLNSLSGQRIEDWLNNVGFPLENVFLNYLRSPVYYDLSMLSEKQKAYIVSKLGNSFIDNEIKKYIKTRHYENIIDSNWRVSTQEELDNLRLFVVSTLDAKSKLTLEQVNSDIADLVYGRI